MPAKGCLQLLEQEEWRKKQVIGKQYLYSRCYRHTEVIVLSQWCCFTGSRGHKAFTLSVRILQAVQYRYFQRVVAYKERVYLGCYNNRDLKVSFGLHYIEYVIAL